MRRRSRIELTLAALVVVCAIAGVAPGLAAATTFCVNPIAGQQCSGTAEPDLQTALTAAHTAPNDTHANTVIVGNPGPAPTSGYTYTTANPATNPVSIVGAGRTATTLTYSGGSSSTVLNVNGDGSSLSNLQIVIPTPGGTGVILIGGHASNILVTSPEPQTNNLIGVELIAGSTPSSPQGAFTNSTISFPTGGSSNSENPVISQIGSVIEDDSISGQNTTPAILAAAAPSGYPNSTVVRRVSLATTAYSAGYGMLVSETTVSADNITLRVGGASTGAGYGFLVESGSGGDAALNLNHVSAYGNADTITSPFNSVAILEGSGSGKTATTNVRNSILRNFFLTTQRTASGAGSVANVRFDYSDYDVIHRLDSNTSGGTGTTTRGVGDLDSVDPGWPNPGGGDFSLPGGSPVINAGDPAPLNPAAESTTDILGHPRISGGRRDMGAVEFQFPAPSFRLGSGTFDPKSGKVALKATCVHATGGRCRFQLTLKAKVKQRGKRKHKHTIKLTLTGSVGSGQKGTLSGKLSHGALKAIAGLSKVRFAVTGSVTDTFGVKTTVNGHVKLKPATPKKKKRHH